MYDPCIRIKSFDSRRSYVLDSKKKPLFIHCQVTSNSKVNGPELIYKVGDDLRKDMLTLQILRVCIFAPFCNYRCHFFPHLYVMSCIILEKTFVILTDVIFFSEIQFFFFFLHVMQVINAVMV